MNDAWFVVTDASGNAVSIGTVVADPLPQGFAVRRLSDVESALLSSQTGVWDSLTQAVAFLPPEPTDV